MPDPQVAQSAAASPATGTVWGFLGSMATIVAAWASKQAWNWHRRRPARVTHDDLAEIREQNSKIMDTLEQLRVGQDARGAELAVLKATVATKDYLNTVIGEWTHGISEQVTHVNERLDNHLDNHPQKAA